MPYERITANLPSRDFAATIAFYGKLGFAVDFHNDGWLIQSHGSLVVEFFPHPNVDPLSSWFSACGRVDDIDTLLSEWRGAGLQSDAKSTPHLTSTVTLPDTPRMFALVDEDGSLLRCLENGS